MHWEQLPPSDSTVDLTAAQARGRERGAVDDAVGGEGQPCDDGIRGLSFIHEMNRRPRTTVRPPHRPAVESIRHDVVVSVGRIAWITTVAVFVIAAICLFFSDYTGYAVLSLAVAVSAAINLR
jgi:hypothetical protein